MDARKTVTNKKGDGICNRLKSSDSFKIAIFGLALFIIGIFATIVYEGIKQLDYESISPFFYIAGVELIILLISIYNNTCYRKSFIEQRDRIFDYQEKLNKANSENDDLREEIFNLTCRKELEEIAKLTN